MSGAVIHHHDEFACVGINLMLPTVERTANEDRPLAIVFQDATLHSGDGIWVRRSRSPGRRRY